MPPWPSTAAQRRSAATIATLIAAQGCGGSSPSQVSWHCLTSTEAGAPSPPPPAGGREGGRLNCGRGTGALLGRVGGPVPVVPEEGMRGQHLLVLRELVGVEQSFELLMKRLHHRLDLRAVLVHLTDVRTHLGGC